MNKKILIALKTKYKNLGFSEKAFEGVADYLATTITGEADIETGISGVESMLKAFQGEQDRVRGENAKLRTQLDEAGKAGQKPEGQDGKPDNVDDKSVDTPEWAKKIIGGIEFLNGEIESLKTDKVNTSRKTQLDEKLKNAPASVQSMVSKNFSKMKFESDNDFDEYLSDVGTQVEEFSKEERINGIALNGKTPKGTSGQGGGNVSDKELDEIIEKLPI